MIFKICYFHFWDGVAALCLVALCGFVPFVAMLPVNDWSLHCMTMCFSPSMDRSLNCIRVSRGLYMDCDLSTEARVSTVIVILVEAAGSLNYAALSLWNIGYCFTVFYS